MIFKRECVAAGKKQVDRSLASHLAFITNARVGCRA